MVAVVLGAVALVAFALPLRHALIATQTYRAGYWATVTDGDDFGRFGWRDPAGRGVRGPIAGVPEDGVWDEEGEGTSDISGARIWVSQDGDAHVRESPAEKDMVLGYAGAGLVLGAVLLLLRARYGRRREDVSEDASRWALKGR
ncbi:hypothetical protein [Streptomyces sp. NPDC052114]|uniref:hypothetical protein n=1 Tax=unclassified Streptomyces TaxID=2593676 RepID=UPI00341C48E7